MYNITQLYLKWYSYIQLFIHQGSENSSEKMKNMMISPIPEAVRDEEETPAIKKKGF